MICDRTLKVLHTCSYCCYHSYTHCNWSRRACVRHPWWRTKRSWPLFSPTFFFFGPGGLRAPPVVADEAKLAIVFTYIFSSFFLSSFFFSLTSGKLPCMKICFPQYFGITRRNIFKHSFFGNLNFFTRFFCFLRPAFGRGALTNP